MATTWTLERRERQAELIRSWKPWEQATGPRTPEGKAQVARNAWQGGSRSRLRQLSKEIKTELTAMREVTQAARL